MDRLADALNGDSGDQIDPATGDVVAGRLAAADDHSIQLTLVMPSDWLPVRVCIVVVLGRDRLPRGGDHGSRVDVPAMRLPGAGDREAARGALPGPAAHRSTGRGTSARTCRRRRGSDGGCGGAGSPRRAAAVAALEALASPAAGPEPGLSTGEWLWRWLESRVSLRASTSRSYAAHMRGYLVPYLGGIPLAALTAGDVQAMFTAIIRDETALGRPVGAATLHRIHATLRAALNGAVRAGLIGVNPGRFPELPRAVRPRPQVWTPALTERWQQDGWRPAVGGVDRRPDGAVPAPGARSPAVRAVPPGRAARAAPRRGRRAAVERPGPGRRDADGDRAAAAARRPDGRRAAEERRRAAGDRAGQDHDRGAARAPAPAAGRAGRRRDPVDRDRVRVHHPDGEAGRAGPDDPPVPRSWSPPPGCRRSRCTGCGTAPPPSPWPPGPT